MRHIFLIFFIVIFFSNDLKACSCSFSWNDSFSLTVKNSEFVALVKIISFDEYLYRETESYEDKISYSMTAEIIKKYKGKESRGKINILGDNGILCRPYLSDFELNGYYLISPSPINNSEDTEYEFFVCRTDFLKVDIASNMAYGKYSLIRNQIDLETFERKLNNGDWDLVIVGFIGSLLILTLIFIRINKKRKFNN